MTHVVSFYEARCRDISLAGGKGANLANLTLANLPVPPGFCVTTQAYDAFAASIGLDAKVAETIAGLDGSADAVEALSGRLRHYIESSAIPAEIAAAIQAAYAKLADDGYVAVRSSGTAEDLAGASFAGLHDTYLDIRGEAEVLDAVKRCWASMWTARATSYRSTKGFDQTVAKIAVVVQVMAEADVAGVMFTANPMTAATDEIVINAAWGLGEALVSGIATPDEHILERTTLKLKEQRLGAKELRVIRNPKTGVGTVTEAVSEPLRERFALSETNLRDLGELGQAVTALYRGMPQDIEWAIARDRLYLLQARPVTGINPSWDEDLEFWQTEPDDPDILWTRAFADEVWNGAISPLCYSYRGQVFDNFMDVTGRVVGIDGGLGCRVFKYRQGEAYYNAEVNDRIIEKSALPDFRPALLAHGNPDNKQKLLSSTYNIFNYIDMLMGMAAKGVTFNSGFEFFEDKEQHWVKEADGKSYEKLARLSDEELEAEFELFVRLKSEFCNTLNPLFWIYARDAMGFLSLLVTTWGGENGAALMADLFCGLPKRTATAEENIYLWRLAEQIRTSDVLTSAFHAAGPDFLAAFEAMPEARDFVSAYREFARTHAHRGHPDRDPYFKRRGDDATIDFNNFHILISTASDPLEREEQVTARRNAAIEEVRGRLKAQSFGWLRLQIFNRLLDYTYRFFLLRDNQRFYFDRFTYAMRRIAVEMGQRLTKRGLLRQVDEIFFLGRAEIYRLLSGDESDPLTRVKIDNRRVNFDAMLEKRAEPPFYLRANRPVFFDDGGGEGGMRGVGTSRGLVTGRAKIVTDLKNIGQVEAGDILVTQSTDPGWTPVFNIIKGIVLETGGMLAHGSCLAREYGFPAVQLTGATKLIPDNAIITVNGDTGEVKLEIDQEIPELVDA